MLQKLEQETGIKRDPRKCIYHRTDRETGEKKLCEKFAIAGGTVCATHGGSAPQVKKAAQLRLTELLLRKVERLDEISEQSAHMPSALGATQAIMNRVMGKVGETKKDTSGGITVVIGAAFGGSPTVAISKTPQLPEATDPDVIDADFTTEEDA